MGKIAEQALPRLLELLDDKNETVSAAAADALGRIGIPENNVVLKLLSITSDNGHPYYPRMHANKSLVAIGTPAVPMLIKALSSNQSRISESALQTLIEIGEPAVDLLTEHLIVMTPLFPRALLERSG
jgi:HEAT repeat protein